MTGDDLRSLVERHHAGLSSECPPDTILTVSLVVVCGTTVFVAALNPEAEEGAPGLEVLKASVARVVQDYLARCPNVLNTRESPGGSPS